MKSLLLSLVILIATVAGVASPNCRVWFTQNVIHRHSKATLAKWKEWDKQHPKWHPKPKAEVLHDFEFACAPVTTMPADVTDFVLEELSLPDFETAAVDLPSEQMPIFPETEDNVYISYVTELGQIYIPPMFGGYWPPIQFPPSLGRPVVPTPEPSTLLLMFTGLVIMSISRCVYRMYYK